MAVADRRTAAVLNHDQGGIAGLQSMTMGYNMPMG
jgi:hypothetical protein